LECFIAYDYYDNGTYPESDTYYHVYYKVAVKAEKKALIGNNWVQDKGAYVALWGSADLLTNATTITPSGWKEIHGGTNGFIDLVVFEEDILDPSGPSIPTSYWVANRNGGSSGIYLTVENHIVVPNY